MQVSEVLDRAADVMERHGKSEDHFIDDDGRCCIIGAIHTALGGEHKRGLVDNAFDIQGGPITRAIMRAVPRGHFHLYNQNNDLPTVLALIRACAMTERAREARMLPVVRETVPA